MELFWIRAHTGLPGNERADELAKMAALRSKVAPVYDYFPLSMAKRVIREATIKKWQDRYTESQTGKVTKMFFPDVKSAYKILKEIERDNLTSQMLTGHGGFKAYLSRFGLTTDSACICDGETVEDVTHILLECPRFMRERWDCECAMDLKLERETLSIAIGNENCRPHFLPYARSVTRKAAIRNGSRIV